MGIGYDVRTAVRRLAAQPSSTTFTILTLGLAIGVAADFSVVDQLILAVALFACWWPTSRALGVEPAEVLRSE